MEGKSQDSDNSAEAGQSGSTKFRQPALSTFPTRDGLESGSGNEHGGDVGRSVWTGDLGGHGDVTGSSAELPLRSVSSSGSLLTRMHSQPTTTAEDGAGSDGAASEGELLNCLLRASSAMTAGAEGSGLAHRRRRRSNAADVETAGIRERTSSPVGVSVVGDLGPRMTTRRRSLPTPRLTVGDVFVPSFTGQPTDVSPESSACSRLPTFARTTTDSTTADVRDDDCLSDIDENTATTTTLTSTASDIRGFKQTQTNSVISGDNTSLVDSSPVYDTSLNRNPEIDGSSQVSVGTDTRTSTRPINKVDDAVEQTACQPNTNVRESSTDSVLRQTKSTVDVDVTEMASSTYLPRRSQSLRLYRVRGRVAARGEFESQQLDANVHEFQTRAAPEREALRNRLRKLSLIYAAPTDADETSRTWPASRRGEAAAAGHVTPTAADPLRRGDDVVSASSSTSTLQLKYDTDSLSSQKDEGFETASISSDVYLSSSQRSSMCDCDASLTTTSTLERPSDPTSSVTIVSTVEPESETLPPPPASFLNEPEMGVADTARSSGDNYDGVDSTVVSRVELESVELDTQHHSDATSSAVSAKEKRRIAASVESGGRDVLPGSAKHLGSMRPAAQTAAGTRQMKTVAARPAPATPRRGSSLTASSISRGASTTRSVMNTNNQPPGRTPAAGRPPASGTVVTASSTSTGLPAPAPFRRSSSLMATDDRKLTPNGRSAPPSAFVRQSQTRASIAAPVLRSNKRAAAEARKAKAAAAASTKTTSSGVTHKTYSPSSSRTTTTTSTSSSLAARPQRVRCRTSSSGSCSSTSSAAAGGPKLAFSSGAVGRRTTTAVSRQPAASVNVPCAPSKKPDGTVTSSSSSKISSNVRRSTQPPNSRLRTPAITRKHYT